jgi:hypothetical protein
MSYALIQARNNNNRIDIGLIFRTQQNGSIYNAMYILPGGNVGIGEWLFPSYRLEVDGVMRVQTTVYNSDERLKDGIKNINSALSSLSGLHGITYKLKAGGVRALTKSALADSGLISNSYSSDTIDTNRLRIGFLAQEVKKVFPHLVYEDKNGILSVDYVSLIPVIVEAMKELKSENAHKDSVIRILTKQVAALQKAIALQEQSIVNLQSQNKNSGSSRTKSAKTDESQMINNSEQDIVLYQNAPNPFTQTTLIRYYLPESVESASLCIYNVQGTLSKTFKISTRGEGSLTISGSEFSAGMYLYTLLADGKEVDTKRMILTE